MSVTAPPRVAQINMAALEQNLRQLAPNYIDIRADAFGHGASRVLQTARACVPELHGAIVSEVELPELDPALLDGLDIRHDEDGLAQNAHAEDPAAGGPDADVSRVSGAAIYGLDADVDTRPVMSVSAQVVLLKPLLAGEGVSYGGSYRCETDTTMALVAIGYSQGIARRGSNRCEAFVAGRRCPVAGSISMDLLSVDVGPLPVAPGDYVELFGANVRLTDWAAATGITPLALSSRIQQSVPRVEVHA